MGERCLLTTSTIKRIDYRKIVKKAAKTVAVLVFWLLVWEVLSRIVSRNNQLLLLLLPGPATVFKTWTEIAFTSSFLTAVFTTMLNVLLGFLFGIGLGVLFGVLTHFSIVINALFSPVMKLIRAVPVVAFIILMYLFLKSSEVPIAVVSLMVMPLMWQTVNDGLSNSDKQLCEMAQVFDFGKRKTFFYVKLPMAMPSVFTAMINSLGLAWKSGVAAEVICEPAMSLGTLIGQGKGSVAYDEVYAVTLTVVILSVILEALIKALSRRIIERTKNA